MKERDKVVLLLPWLLDLILCNSGLNLKISWSFREELLEKENAVEVEAPPHCSSV